MLKPIFVEFLICPVCRGSLNDEPATDCLVCSACGAQVKCQNGVPLFTSLPGKIVPSEKQERGPDIGTPWRQANWRFLETHAKGLDPRAIILDVGAGRGDFADLFHGRNYLSLDIYPYPEVDLVCDLTQMNPFKPACMDVVVLMNVMEHVYDTRGLLKSLGELLKPGGLLIIAIPFLIKIHQAPFDYVRYTHFAIENLAAESGFEVQTLEGYYDPLSLLGEGIGNLQWSVVPALQGSRRTLARALVAILRWVSGLFDRILGPGKSLSPAATRSQSPTGYQVVFRKRLRALTN